eukprot:3961257-Amphidinium_carterae.1
MRFLPTTTRTTLWNTRQVNLAYRSTFGTTSTDLDCEVLLQHMHPQHPQADQLHLIAQHTKLATKPCSSATVESSTGTSELEQCKLPLFAPRLGSRCPFSHATWRMICMAGTTKSQGALPVCYTGPCYLCQLGHASASGPAV